MLLNAMLFCLYITILCWDLTGFTLATPTLISRPILYLYKFLVGTISWLVYLVILLCMLNLLLWTLFSRMLPMVQLFNSHLSVWLSLLMLCGHVVLFLVRSLGMPRLTIGMICVLSLLMYVNHCQYHKSAKFSTGSNYCEVDP